MQAVTDSANDVLSLQCHQRVNIVEEQLSESGVRLQSPRQLTGLEAEGGSRNLHEAAKRWGRDAQDGWNADQPHPAYHA
jgi:hypothetical protein